jgi:hypothetical protein
MKLSWLLGVGIILAASPAGFVPDKTVKKAAPAKKASLSPAVKKAVQQGINFLRAQQLKDGSWEIDEFAKQRPGGWTALVLLALLEAGVPPNDPAVVKGLVYLRKLEPNFIYVRALQTMVFARVGNKLNKQLVQRNVDWLIAARVQAGGQLLGWTYTKTSQVPDNSNTSFAVRGLHAGRLVGAKIPRKIWEDIRSYYLRTQLKDGGWIYAGNHNSFSYLTMDVASLSGLLMGGMALNLNPELPQKNGRLEIAKVKRKAPPGRALLWISGKRYDIAPENRVYYHLYGVSELGLLSGLRFLGIHDWYAEGSKVLLKRQAPNGSWPRKGFQFDRWPLINTSFALIFLANPP